MALRDQPYLPLFIQDFLTDEKLIECSASATGVYIRLMCIMHKSEYYGSILLKQNDKQNDKQILNFACKLSKQMPYTTKVIEDGLTELLTEKVISIEGDVLMQKRMIHDNSLSLTRSKAGKIGGSKNKFASHFAQAKAEANAETVIEIEIESDNKDLIKYAENFKKQLLEDTYALESSAMNNGLSPIDIAPAVEMFFSTKIATGEASEWKTYKEAKRNFIYWLKFYKDLKIKHGKENSIGRVTESSAKEFIAEIERRNKRGEFDRNEV